MSAFGDDFNRADSTNLGANWTEASGDFEIQTNALAFVTTGNARGFAIYNTATAGLSQYVKIAATFDAANGFALIAVRYVDASSPFYAIEFDDQVGNLVRWYGYDNATTEGAQVDSGTVAFASGDTFGVTVTGTGTGTELRVWLNPTGDAPSSVSVWGGAGPGLTLTADPPTAADTGLLVGVGGHCAAADDLVMDNFFGGDVPTAVSAPMFRGA